jgi:group I intron endonuclease
MSIWRKSGIYAIRNKQNGKLYIGSTGRTFRIRWKEHRSKLRAGTHWNTPLQAAWNKYGEDGFAFEVLEIITERSAERIIEREQYWLDVHENKPRCSTYNIRPQADSCLGYEMPRERRQEISQRVSDYWQSEQNRNRMSEAMRETWARPDYRQAKSEAAKRQWADPKQRQKKVAGIKAHSNKLEVRQARSRSAKMYMSKPEERASRSAKMKQQLSTAEMRQAIRDANRRRWTRPGEKKRLSERMKGQWQSSEYRQKITNATAKTFDGFVSPDGLTYTNIFNLKAFCQKHGLNYSAMVMVNSGARPHHRGWTRLPEAANGI